MWQPGGCLLLWQCCAAGKGTSGSRALFKSCYNSPCNRSVKTLNTNTCKEDRILRFNWCMSIDRWRFVPIEPVRCIYTYQGLNIAYHWMVCIFRHVQYSRRFCKIISSNTTATSNGILKTSLHAACWWLLIVGSTSLLYSLSTSVWPASSSTSRPVFCNGHTASSTWTRLLLHTFYPSIVSSSWPW